MNKICGFMIGCTLLIVFVWDLSSIQYSLNIYVLCTLDAIYVVANVNTELYCAEFKWIKWNGPVD